MRQGAVMLGPYTTSFQPDMADRCHRWAGCVRMGPSLARFMSGAGEEAGICSAMQLDFHILEKIGERRAGVGVVR